MVVNLWLSPSSLCVLGAHQAVAKFNARGIAGSILFTEVEGGVRIETSLKGLRAAAPGNHSDLLFF